MYKHGGKDRNTHMYKHLLNLNHVLVTLHNFFVLNKGYRYSNIIGKRL